MISQQVCEEMLREHGVKPTANRIVVVKALADAERPLSLSELEYKILSIDKSGVFRALTLFRDHHLVHVIEDGGDGVRYELCHSHNGHEHDDDQHVHFYCERCHRTFCINDMPYPPSCFRRVIGYIASTTWLKDSARNVLQRSIRFQLYLKVEARALDGIGTYLTVGNGDVFGMNGIPLQGFFALQGAIEHDVGIRRCQTPVNVYLDV